MSWGVAEVLVDVEKSEGGDVGKCVGAPHPSLTHFLTPPQGWELILKKVKK